MTIKVLRIEKEIVTCCIMDGDKEDSLIDIGMRWFDMGISEGDIIEFEFKKR